MRAVSTIRNDGQEDVAFRRKWQPLLMLPLLACIALSCSRVPNWTRVDDAEKVFEDLYYDGPLDPAEVVGFWVMTRDSLSNVVRAARLQHFTRQSDHIVYLRGDGRCVYRGFISYTIPPGKEKLEYEQWMTDAFGMGIGSEGGFYVWEPESEEVVMGPFGAAPEVASGDVLKTKLTYWRLGSIDEGKGPDFSGRCVEFIDQEIRGSFLTLSIGRMNGELCLWRWMRDAFVREKTGTVRWEKVSKQELREILERDAGGDTRGLAGEAGGRPE